MADAPVATDVHQALDVELNGRAELAFHLVALAGDHVTDRGDVLVAPILHLHVVADLSLLKNCASGTSPDSVDIGQPYLASFIFG